MFSLVKNTFTKSNIVNKHLKNNINLELISKTYNNINCFTINSTDNNNLDYKLNNRLPISIALVIDVSGSMNEPITINGQEMNLTIIQVVIHSAKTVVNSLSENDELSLITYSNISNVIFGFMKMNNTNKNRVIDILDNITAEGSTNIYHAVKMANSIFRNNKSNINNRYIYLLSDGHANIQPSNGTLNAIKNDYQIMINDNYSPPIINTFGFGYDVDYTLLNDIATINKGVYSFIPDGNFVGTIITNNLANTICKYYDKVFISIELEPNTIYKLLDDYIYTYNNNILTIYLNTINIGFLKSIIVILYKPFINCKLYCNQIIDNTNIFIDNIIDYDKNYNDLYYHLFRTKCIELINTIMLYNNYDKSKSELNKLISEITNYVTNKNKNDYFIKIIFELLKDITGEISKSIEYDAYRKWGNKYLPSLKSAHLLQERNNFKDFGIQHYGRTSELYCYLSEMFSNIFDQIPAPKGKNKNNINVTHVSNMNMINNSNADCFHGDCKVLMNNNTKKLVKDIVKGDIVYGGGVIEFVKRTKVNRTVNICQSKSGLIITTYHPIRYQNKIMFPCQCDLFEIVSKYVNYTYTFVIQKDENNKRQPFVIINNIECITLGHGITNDSVAEHPFFGTEKIIDGLKKFDGYKKGMITFKSMYNLYIYSNDDTDNIKIIDYDYENIEICKD